MAWPILGKADIPDIIVPNVPLPSPGMALALPAKDAYGRAITARHSQIVFAPACGSCSARRFQLRKALDTRPGAVFVFDYEAKDQTDKLYRRFSAARIVFDPSGHLYRRNYVLIAPFVVRVSAGRIMKAEKM